MTLTLDPRYPIVWRTPNSLQLGVDNPPVVLESVTLGHERMLAALAVGLTPAGLALIGTESGLSCQQIEAFHRSIEPALARRVAPKQQRVVVAGTGPTVNRLCLRLAEAGIEPHPTGSQPDAAVATPELCHTDFAIVVTHFVLDPQFRSLWLRRDTPHLSIVFGDMSATIGPIIEPGVGPCLYCLELDRRDADPAWPALASQLFGMRSTAETPFLASEVATLATRLAVTRLLGDSSALTSSLTVDATTGKLTRQSRNRHPDCACRDIADVSAITQQGIGTVRSRQNADRSTTPTTTGAVSVPG